MEKMKKVMKNVVMVILALYLYFAVLFILGFVMTWLTVRLSLSVLGFPLTDSLMYISAGIIYTSTASLDMYLVSRKEWSPATVILSIPFVIYGFVKSAVKKTSFTFDTTQAPGEYKELNDCFKNVFRPIRRHFT